MFHLMEKEQRSTQVVLNQKRNFTGIGRKVVLQYLDCHTNIAQQPNEYTQYLEDTKLYQMISGSASPSGTNARMGNTLTLAPSYLQCALVITRRQHY